MKAFISPVLLCGTCGQFMKHKDGFIVGNPVVLWCDNLGCVEHSKPYALHLPTIHLSPVSGDAQ